MPMEDVFLPSHEGLFLLLVDGVHGRNNNNAAKITHRANGLSEIAVGHNGHRGVLASFFVIPLITVMTQEKSQHFDFLSTRHPILIPKLTFFPLIK